MLTEVKSDLSTPIRTLRSKISEIFISCQNRIMIVHYGEPSLLEAEN